MVIIFEHFFQKTNSFSPFSLWPTLCYGGSLNGEGFGAHPQVRLLREEDERGLYGHAKGCPGG